MTRRWLLGTIPILLCGLLLAAWSWWSPDAINPSTYQRIHLGMTQGEIEKVIGLPAGNSGRGSIIAVTVLAESQLSEDPFPRDQLRAIWTGSRYAILVRFDDEGTAIGCSLYEVSRRPALLGMLRSWLGW